MFRVKTAMVTMSLWERSQVPQIMIQCMVEIEQQGVKNVDIYSMSRMFIHLSPDGGL